MRIYFITSNQSKFEWAKRRFFGSRIDLVQKELQIEESRAIKVEEVVLDKAKKAQNKLKEPFIIEDTGFCIPSLSDFPSTHIKLVIGTIGINGILKLLEGSKDRTAIFRSALVFSHNGKTQIFVCNDFGTISMSPKGEHLRGFNDLFKIFIPDGFKKTLAEMSDGEFLEYEKKIEIKDHYLKFLKELKEV